MNRTQTKIISFIIVEIIVLSLLFTGVFTIKSKNTQSLSKIGSLDSSSKIISSKASDNYIYVLTLSIQNTTSLIKYNSNLTQIWKFTYNYSNLFSGPIGLNIIAANDQNVLILLSTFILYPRQFLLIVDQNGIKAKFDINGFTPILLAYSYYSVLSLGDNYFIATEKLLSNAFQIAGYSLKPDNTSQTLFYRNFSDKIFLINSFYRDSHRIEIPYYKQPLTSQGGSTNDTSYALEYNIITGSITQKTSNYVSVVSKLNNVQALINGSLYKSSFLFPFNQNYIGLGVGIYPTRTQFKIWSNTSLLTETSFNLFSNSKLNPSNNIFVNMELPFQIENKCYMNLIFQNSQSQINLMPVLVLYNKDLTYSYLQVLIYPNLLTSSETLVSVSSTHLKDIIVLYGEIHPNSGHGSYFIKFYTLRPSILEKIFQIPLFLKFLIGLIFILPPVWYLIKKSGSVVSSEDTYPLYKE